GRWPKPACPWPLRRICCPSAKPDGIFTSTSFPVGSCTRFFTPLAASANVMVSDAATSRPRSSAPTSSSPKRKPLGHEPRPPPAPPDPPSKNPPNAAKAPKPAGAAAPAALETAGAPAETLEDSLATEAAWAGAKPLKPLEARLAFGVDLAAVERLAFLLLAQNFVGCVELGKARSRLWIMLVGVGVQLLRELAEGALDLSGAGTLGNPQDLIGVAHAASLPGESSQSCRVPSPTGRCGERRRRLQ